jgi:hypothetical protein
MSELKEQQKFKITERITEEDIQIAYELDNEQFLIDKNLLNNYVKCMNPELEKIIGRMQQNKAYVSSDLNKFCQQERLELNNNNNNKHLNELSQVDSDISLKMKSQLLDIKNKV